MSFFDPYHVPDTFGIECPVTLESINRKLDMIIIRLDTLEDKVDKLTNEVKIYPEPKPRFIPDNLPRTIFPGSGNILPGSGNILPGSGNILPGSGHEPIFPAQPYRSGITDYPDNDLLEFEFTV